MAKGEARREIGDYGVIGNGRSIALIDRDGELAWLCWPRFDSDACFASLLGDRQHGHWTIAPDGAFRSSRRYRHETLVLETRFETESGIVTLTDFMPTDSAGPCVVRLARCERGRLALHSEFQPVFGNGRFAARFSKNGDVLVAREELGDLELACSRPVEPEMRLELAAGEEVAFVLGARPHDPLAYAQEALKRCEREWRKWCSQCSYEGPWRDVVLRSLITLKALIYQPTGGIIAAGTTSLPETFGGSRNWDYRFCWIRDSTLCVLALLHAGYRNEAREWVQWLLDAITPHERRVQPVYGVLGNSELTEENAGWLPGFRNSQPVRFGNAAYLQEQLDIYGEVQDTLHQWRKITGIRVEGAWEKQAAMLHRLEQLWRKPDAGFWEQRSNPQHFTQSRALCWVAYDRAVKSVEQFGFEGPVGRWSELRAQIHDEVCTRGFNSRLNAFTRSYGSETLDASTLLIPTVGFLPADDPRLVGTVDAVNRHLMRDGFVYRYDQSLDDDGIREKEGAFLACCFWYDDCLVLQKREDEAAALFEKHIGAANDLGLMPEEYDVSTGSLLGNLPQALSHLALVQTAQNLSGSGPAHTRSDSNHSEVKQ